jgi:hypothetical protein
MEFCAVDAIVDVVQLARRHADGQAQPGFDVPAHGNVVRHKRPGGTAQQIVFPVLAIEVEHVASMLAMHGGTNASGRGDELRFQRCQVAGMHQIGFKLAQQFP